MLTRDQKIQRLRECQAEAERAKGRAEVAVANLREAGYATRKEAAEALEALSQSIKEKEAQFEAEYAAFEAEWAAKSQE